MKVLHITAGGSHRNRWEKVEYVMIGMWITFMRLLGDPN